MRHPPSATSVCDSLRYPVGYHLLRARSLGQESGSPPEPQFARTALQQRLRFVGEHNDLRGSFACFTGWEWYTLSEIPYINRGACASTVSNSRKALSNSQLSSNCILDYRAKMKSDVGQVFVVIIQSFGRAALNWVAVRYDLATFSRLSDAADPMLLSDYSGGKYWFRLRVAKRSLNKSVCHRQVADRILDGPQIPLGITVYDSEVLLRDSHGLPTNISLALECPTGSLKP
jgi:hypothetical protein